MNHWRASVAEVRRLQQGELARRAEHPELALRGAVQDLVTSCGFQYFADHHVGDDVDLVGSAADLLTSKGQKRTGSAFEVRSLECVHRLSLAITEFPRPWADLEQEDAVRGAVVEIPPLTLLGRFDEESSAELICWNEANCLIEGIGTAYRCASRISALSFLGTADRYSIVGEMVAIRQRYESHPDERTSLESDIRDRVERFVDWFGSSRSLE